MTFQKWLVDFMKDKKPVEPGASFADHALRKVERFVDRDGIYWEFGFTFTHRLVIRKGWPLGDSTWHWTDWETLHEVIVPEILNH